MLRFLKIDSNEDRNEAFEMIKASSDKTLVINLIQEDREMEKLFDIQDLIIYNSYDYFSGLVNFDKAYIEVTDGLSWLASTYKKSDHEIELDKVIELTKGFEESFVLMTSDQLEYFNDVEVFSKIDETKDVDEKKGFWAFLKRLFGHDR